MKISKRKIGILLVFIIVILIEGISFATYQSGVKDNQNDSKLIETKKRVDADAAYLSEEEQEVLDLINEYREKNNLPKLQPFSELQKVSKIKAEDIVDNNYFSHVSPRLGTPFEMLVDNNIEYTKAGENLAGNETPEKAVEAWINSKSHRDNILDSDFEYTGISVIESPVYGKVFVQTFIGIITFKYINPLKKTNKEFKMLIKLNIRKSKLSKHQ